VNEEASKLTFNIMTRILFGKSIIKEIPLIPYIDPSNGNGHMLTVYESFSKIVEDLTQSTFSLLALMLPFTLDYDLTIKDRRIKKNYDSCLNVI